MLLLSESSCYVWLACSTFLRGGIFAQVVALIRFFWMDMSDIGIGIITLLVPLPPHTRRLRHFHHPHGTNMLLLKKQLSSPPVFHSILPRSINLIQLAADTVRDLQPVSHDPYIPYLISHISATYLSV